MKIDYRVKVRADSARALTSRGLAVNLHDCNDGEYYVVGPDEHYLQLAIDGCKLDVIGKIEKI